MGEEAAAVAEVEGAEGQDSKAVVVGVEVAEELRQPERANSDEYENQSPFF